MGCSLLKQEGGIKSAVPPGLIINVNDYFGKELQALFAQHST